MERLHPRGAWAQHLEPSVRRELESLTRETDDHLYLEGLFTLALREERAGRVDIAAELYAEIVGANLGPHRAPPVRERWGVAPLHDGGGRTQGSPLRQRAQRALDAILGRGAAGPRAEFLLRGLAQQASDPAAIFAMGAAGSVFRMTRLAALSRLAMTPSGNILTRGLGARVSAGALGFLAEAPAFTTASRLGNAALGREQDWGLGAIGREFAGGALTLLGLKAFGGLSGLALRRYAQGPGFAPGMMRAVLPQAAMLAGILSSHRLEARLGLRDHHDGATEFTDAFATLLQFHAGGRLAHHAFGEAHARGERLLDARGETLAALPRFEASGLPLPPFAAAGAPPGFPNLVFSMAAGSGRGRRAGAAQLPLPYETGLAAPRRHALPPGLPLELRLAEGARGADAAILRSSLAYLARQGRPLSRAEQIGWIREHRLAGGIPLLGEWFRQNGAESAAALAALRGFGASHRAEVVFELRQALRHPHLLVVAPALEGLVALRAVEALPELRELSAAFPTPIAMLAETARVELGDPEMIPVLRPRAFTWQPSALDRIAALEALGRLGQVEEVLPELRGFFRYSRTVYFRAGLALTRLRSEAAIPNPAEMLDAASLAERADWAEAYAASGRPERAAELWRPLLESGDSSVQERALSRLGPAEVRSLLPALNRLRAASPYPEMRRRAAELLISAARERGDRETLESYLAALEPSSIQATEHIQIAAARARLALGAHPAATERLETYLESRFPANRLRSAEALLEGGEHAGARRALEALWQDGNFEIRHRAFAVWSRSRAPRAAANSGPLGSLAALLAAGSGLSLLLHPAVAEASFGMQSGGATGLPWFLAGMGGLLAGGVAMALQSGRGEGPRRGSDRPPHANLLGWFENPANMEERYFLAPPPETVPETQRFLTPPEPGQVLTLGRASRGRGDNLFPPELRNISRRHMDLRVHEGTVEVRVHDGSLGLRINGRNLAPFQWYALRDRDVVEFVSEAGRDVFGTEPHAEEPGEFVTVTRRLGRNPVEEQDVPAIFVFRLPRPPQTPVPPRPRRNLLEQVQGLFRARPEEAAPAEEPRRDSTPVAAFHDPEEVFAEIQRFSSLVSTPMPLLEMSLSQPDWLDPHEQRGAAARRDTLRSLVRIHRQICGKAEQWVSIATPAAGVARPSYQSLRMPRWDGILRQRLETYRQGLERLREERGDFPLYALANQELNSVADRLNRLFEVVQLFRRHFTAPEEQAQFDAIDAAYRGLRSDVANDGQRVRTATRGIDVTVRRRQRQGWAEEFSGFAGGSRAMVNMRILMGEIREVHGLPVAGSLYSALSSSTVYDRGERVVRNVRILFEAGNGQIVAFDDGSPNVRRLVQQHRDQGRRIEEAMISVDARASGRITAVAVLGEARDSVVQALEGLRGLRVLPPQVVYGFTGFAGEPEARAFRVDLVPDVDAPPEQWYRVAGLVRNLREGYSLLTLEPNTPELGLPGLQLWVSNMEVLDLAVGDPVTALPES